MATLRSKLTLAIVTADDELAKKLIEAGEWEAADVPAPRKRAPRKVVEAESGE